MGFLGMLNKNSEIFTFLSLFTFVLMLFVTIIAWNETKLNEHEKGYLRFESIVRESKRALINRMNSYEDALLGGVGFFAGSNHVSLEEWKKYVAVADVKHRYPGINGIGYIVDVPENEINSYSEDMKLAISPDFKIKPEVDHNDYFIIQYIEPISINKEAVGLNIAFEENRKRAALKSRDSGMAAITKRILLVQDNTKTPGFLLLLPLYKNDMPTSTVEERRLAFDGWVYAPFVGKNFMTGLTSSQNLYFHMHVYDGANKSDDNFIYDSGWENPVYDSGLKHHHHDDDDDDHDHHHSERDDSLFVITKTINIKQQQWTIEWKSSVEFENSIKSYESNLVLISGLMLSLLVSSLLLMLSSLYKRANKLANKMTSDFSLALDKQRAILNTVVDGIITINSKGIIESFNPSAERMFGYKEDEVIGKNVKILMPEPYQSKHDGYLNNHLSTGKKKIIDTAGREVQARRKDGSIFDMELAVKAFNVDEAKMFVGSIHDITQKKNADERLQQYAEDLEWQKMAMEEAKEEAERANRLKSDFLATMSHEIRTPMNGIMGMTELLLNSELNPKQEANAKTVMSSSEALLEIINDILDFSKIEAGKLELEPVQFNLETVCEDVSELLSIKCKEKAIELILRYPPYIRKDVIGDSGRIRQIITNLLSNAVKFTSKGTVILSVEELKNDKLKKNQVEFKISVSDTGIGIDEDAQEYIFDKFSQADNTTTRKFGGTGLGLAISKQLSEMMGGQIAVESKKGEGSTFWFTIIIDKGKVEDNHVYNLENVKGIKALIVDDVEINQIILQEQLGSAGIDCDICSSGKEALELLSKAADNESCYDIVLLDYLMPNMNGEQLATEIIKQETLKDTCVIMLSSDGGSARSGSFKELGLAGYLSKPIRSRQVIEAISIIWDKKLSKEKNFFITVEDTFNNRENYKNIKFDNVNVLVAEDNRVNQVFAKEILESFDCKVFVASNGKEAIDLLDSSNPDIIFMDINMPQVNGLEATKEILKLDKYKNIPIIALTAADIEDERDECFDAGMVSFISKPMRKNSLYRSLAKYLPENKIIRADSVNNILSNKRILLVEDNRVNREFAIELLESFGCIIEVAGNGLEALEQFGKDDYDAILMDCQMPEMDGYEATNEIRKLEKNGKLEHTPIIALTANAMKGDSEKCLAAGMDEYLSKPVRQNDLRKALERWIDEK